MTNGKDELKNINNNPTLIPSVHVNKAAAHSQYGD